jgi:hypothetical protein
MRELKPISQSILSKAYFKLPRLIALQCLQVFEAIASTGRTHIAIDVHSDNNP